MLVACELSYRLVGGCCVLRALGMLRFCFRAFIPDDAHMISEGDELGGVFPALLCFSASLLRVRDSMIVCEGVARASGFAELGMRIGCCCMLQALGMLCYCFRAFSLDGAHIISVDAELNGVYPALRCFSAVVRLLVLSRGAYDQLCICSYLEGGTPVRAQPQDTLVLDCYCFSCMVAQSLIGIALKRFCPSFHGADGCTLPAGLVGVVNLHGVGFIDAPCISVRRLSVVHPLLLFLCAVVAGMGDRAMPYHDLAVMGIVGTLLCRRGGSWLGRLRSWLGARTALLPVGSRIFWGRRTRPRMRHGPAWYRPSLFRGAGAWNRLLRRP